MEKNNPKNNNYSTLSNISMNSSALRGFVDAVNSIKSLSKEIAEPDGKYVCAKSKNKT